MASHIRENRKCLLTKMTRKRFFACVAFEVIRQTLVLTIGLITLWTRKRFLFSVSDLVFLQSATCAKIFSTFRTFVWLLSSVYHLVFGQMIGRLQVGITMCARETGFIVMASHVVRQCSLARKLSPTFHASEIPHLCKTNDFVYFHFLLDFWDNLEIVFKVTFFIVDTP